MGQGRNGTNGNPVTAHTTTHIVTLTYRCYLRQEVMFSSALVS